MMFSNLIGVSIIVFIVWWFWLSRPKARVSPAEILEITLEDGVFVPSHVAIPAGKPIALQFLRKDPSPCAESVNFSDLDLSCNLNVDQPVVLKLPALAPGEYAFTCQMQMYQGRLIVKPE